MPEFQRHQPVRVRKEGGDSVSQPDKSLLGKEGTIEYGMAIVEGGPSTAYFMEFDDGEVFAITGDWLELR